MQYLFVKTFTVIDGLFAVIHSITNTTLFHFLFFDCKFFTCLFKIQFNYSHFPRPSHPSLIIIFILFCPIIFPLACTRRMLARLLDQAFKRIGHPSQGQHVQLVSILHHLCSDSDPIDQVWNFGTIFM